MKKSMKIMGLDVLRVVLIVVVTIMVWEAVNTVPTAEAQKSLLPNSAEQRKQMIQQLKASNATLGVLVDEVKNIKKSMEAGDIEVKTK